MPVLNDAEAIFLGERAAEAVYLGRERVWPPPSGYVLAVLADNPLAYFRLGEFDRFQPMLDSSGNGNHGAYLNNAAIQPGAPGAISDDTSLAVGAGNLIPATASGVALPAGSPLTIEYWRRGAGPTGHQGAFSIGSAANVCDGWITNQTPAGARLVYGGSANHFHLGDITAALTSGDWFHVVFTVASTGARAGYLNGVQVAALNVTQMPAAAFSSLRIGTALGQAMSQNVGWDEFAVYGHELGADRVAAHYVASGRIVAAIDGGTPASVATAALDAGRVTTSDFDDEIDAGRLQ